MSSRIINSEKLAFMLSSARANAGKSQKFMAQALGKSIGTIQNWESGIGAPNIIDMMEWFEILNINPLKYFLDFLHPDTFNCNSSSNNTEVENEKSREALLTYLKDFSPDEDIKKLHYCVLGNTDSSWSALLDLMTAYKHLPAKSRVSIAQHIIESYELEKDCETLLHPDSVMPNEAKVKIAIQDTRRSIIAENL